MLRRAADFVAKQAPRPKQAPWVVGSLQVPGGMGPASTAVKSHDLGCNCIGCAPASARQFVSFTDVQQHPKTCGCEGCAFGSQRRFVTSTAAVQAAGATQPDTYHVPLGHLTSDLASVSCHIGLGRRRDLTLRADLSLTSMGGQEKSLGEWFHVLPHTFFFGAMEAESSWNHPELKCLLQLMPPLHILISIMERCRERLLWSLGFQTVGLSVSESTSPDTRSWCGLSP